MQIFNPATEEVIAEIAEDHLQSLTQKMRLLQNGQKLWQEIPLHQRVGILQQFSDLLLENEEWLAKTLTDEVGKPLQQSLNELKGARSRIKWLTENAEKYLRDEIMTEETHLVEKISYEPLGVICNISAWNYPYLVGVNVFVPALLAGNAVLYKPSEFATLTGLEIEKLLHRAGVPKDAFQIAIGAKEVGAALLNLPFDGYFFTGSYKTGKFIYEKVAHKMVPVGLELGGKDPLYVADDVLDIAAVAAAAADGAFYNNGQSCCSVERIYVHEKIYDAFLDAFVKVVKSWKQGAPTEEDVYFTVLTRKDQIEVLENQVADAMAKGATLLLGGRAREGKGYYFEPTVIANATNQMLVMREESFGPIIGIAKVKDDEEAITLMNDTEYGLTAAVYSNSESRAQSILAKINSGTAYWNCCDRVSAALPWSGRKHSGFGSTLSHVGLRTFTRPKSYHLKR
jgi:acyl-CoA reductase-like NAD-dependent aldehyde dehydrogenase